jgi:Fic family protein
MPSKPSAKPAKTTKSLPKAAKPAAKPVQAPAKAQPKAKKPSAPPPVRRAPPAEPPKPVLTMEERTALLEARLLKTPPEFQQEYRDNFDMSWIYHDSAIEGVVYTFQELKTAIDPTAQVVADSSLQPACEEIRRHREALNFIRDYAPKKRQPVTVDLLKRIYLILHPEEGDLKTVRYRKDIPQHRLYFHEYAPPDKITYKVRAVVEWANDPETRRTRSPIRLAARAHYDLLRVFPFPNDSGKVARLFMNLLLLRAGYPPAIVHSTERQRYYEALKGSSAAMMQIVQEAIDNNIGSVEKLLDAHDAALKEKELEA